MNNARLAILIGLFLAVFIASGCGSGGDANAQKIGAQCTTVADCGGSGDGGSTAVQCLTNFKGGYCGRKDCTKDSDCPTKSICVGLNGTNYCFLVCTDKSECNQNRTLDNEANCSSSVNPVDGGTVKVCVPPSGT